MPAPHLIRRFARSFVRASLGRFPVFAVGALCLVRAAGVAADSSAGHWVGTWATAPLAEPAEKEKLPLSGATLRQIVHVSLGGRTWRVRLSNAFGESPLVLRGAHVALAATSGAINPGSDRPLRFHGQPDVAIPPGAVFLSDPLDFELPAQADVAISLCFERLPTTLTVHGGSRTTSFLQPGDALASATLPGAVTFTRWYFINGIDVLSPASSAAALAVLGDSITDGHGATTDANDRWPDDLVRRIQQQPEIRPIGLLNLGIGGNRLLRDGLGPNALARFDRDVLAQSGVRWLLVLEGINDLGTRHDARPRGQPFATAADIIGAYEQIIARAHAHGLRVIGGTISPYRGADFYFTEDGEADRQAVNQWIRTSGRFDAVVDFDAALRDPADPTRLAPAFDHDHLHPSLAGYQRMADAIDLALFNN